MKTLLLTGATGDIGKAIKAEFETNGFTVLAPTREEMCLSEPDSITHYMDKLDKSIISSFIHCAGYNQPENIDSLPLSEVSKTMQINAIAFFQIVKLLAPSLRKYRLSHILGISSIYGLISRPKRLAYSASKQAINAMVQTMALELGKDGVMVNALAPGFIDTQLTRKNNSPDKIAEFIEKIPLGRLGTPLDIAKIAYWLCSDNNAFIHGQCIVADGGYTIGGFEK